MHSAKLWRSVCGVGVGCGLLLAAIGAQAASVGLREAITGATEIGVGPSGGSVDLELFLDTGGLSFEGYYLGVDFTGGSLTIESVTHQPLPGLFGDLFSAPVIDNDAQSIRHLNQTTFTTPLGAGEYVLDVITIDVGPLTGGAEIIGTPGLFGEVLGLAGGACPGTVEGCTVSFSSVHITPEPATALLLAGGILGLALQRSQRRIQGQ